MIRDYLYITDLVDMIITIFDKSTKFQVYNLGSGGGVTINELINCMKKVTRRSIHVDYKPNRATDVHQVLLDMKRFELEFGVPRLTPMETGVKKTWQYVLEQETR